VEKDLKKAWRQAIRADAQQPPEPENDPVPDHPATAQKHDDASKKRPPDDSSKGSKSDDISKKPQPPDNSKKQTLERDPERPLEKGKDPAQGVANKYLPDNAAYLVRVNFQQMQKSELLKPYVGLLKEKLKSGDAQKHLEALGFDPFKDLGTLTVAGPVSKDFEQHLVILTGKFDVEKFQKAAKEAAKKGGDEVLKSTMNGNYTVWVVSPPNTRPPAPSTYFVTLVDENTILVAGGKKLLQDSLAKASGKKKSQLSKEIAPLIAKTDPKESVSVLVLTDAIAKADFIPEKFAEKVKEEAEKFKFLRFGVVANEDIKIKFILGTKDEDTAKQIADQVDQVKFVAPLMLATVAGDPQKQKELKPAMDAVKEVLNSLETSSKGKLVHIELTITKKLFKKIKDQAMKAMKKEEKKEDE
jgi:hypothetical protein